MNRKVIIIGASGHGKVVADIVRANNDIIVGFLDDDPIKTVLGDIDSYINYLDTEFIIAIGDADHRRMISEKLKCAWYTAIHPSAVISPSASIGEGSVIMANAVVNADAVIGKHCIINTSAIIEHEDLIDDYCHISVGVKLGGMVRIGKMTWVGIGATVNNNISICDNCFIGAGAVVVKDIFVSGKYIGVPAKIREER